jgi:predicted aconitase with swiveling domain
MKLKGRAINPGHAKGQAFVLDVPFSFIGDLDPDTGRFSVVSHPMFGEVLADKILVCPTGKGGTIAQFVAYQTWKNGKAPAAILCDEVEPILCECALVINIPLLASFDESPVRTIQTGQFVTINGDEVSVE